MWPGLETDNFGELSQICIDRSLYSDVAIFKTAYWFTDRFYIFLDSPNEGRVLVELRSKDPAQPSDLKAACAEFCNSLIDFRVRDLVAQETMGIRETLVTKAFMEGIPKSSLSKVSIDEQTIVDSK